MNESFRLDITLYAMGWTVLQRVFHISQTCPVVDLVINEYQHRRLPC
jgi:hypothetical protein